MAGLPIAGIGTMFYAVLWVAIGATKLWRWGSGWAQRIGRKEQAVPARDAGSLRLASPVRAPRAHARAVSKSVEF